MKNKRNHDILRHKDIHSLSFLTIFISLLIVISLSTSTKLFAYSINNFKSQFLKNNVNQETINNFVKKINKKETEKDFSSLENLNIEAKSFVVYDVNNNKVLASKNENQILPLASLTKIVTAITAINIAKNENEDIVIRKDYLRADEYLDDGLKEGQRWKLSELLKYGLTISSNSSMDIIASTVSNSNQDFVNEMNIYIKKLGYKNFNFNSASGLDYGDIIGGKGTALEYARLFAYSYKTIPEIMSYTVNSKINLNSNSEKIYQIPNTNKKAGNTVGLLASKTGFTDAAGGNLAIMFNEGINRTFVIVVLGSSVEGRFNDVNKLYKNTKLILEN